LMGNNKRGSNPPSPVAKYLKEAFND